MRVLAVPKVAQTDHTMAGQIVMKDKLACVAVRFGQEMLIASVITKI